jgi:CubicO group peptidase (beta-lactamase class C family)
MERVESVLDNAVGSGVVPGAVALVRHQGAVVLHRAFGEAQSSDTTRPMSLDTRFDLASLTKPLVGAGVALALVDRGAVSLDEEITRFLPELRSVHGTGVTLRRLLSHSAGVRGWRPLYVWARTRDDILEAVDGLGLASDPGSRFEYSDIGFIVLGIALERIGRSRLDDLARELLFTELGLERTSYTPTGPAEDFAVTERGNAFERRMAEWAGMDFADWRTEFHPGEVNDGNSHYGLGGVSAHAGLFSDAADLGVLGEMWRNGGSWEASQVLSSAVIAAATSDQAPAGARRGLGWELMKSGAPSLAELSRADAGFFPPTASPFSPRSSGELLSDRAFGHTGFTGTSMWIDPERELVMVLLTNATHPAVDLDRPLNALRARFHNAAVASVTSAP